MRATLLVAWLSIASVAAAAPKQTWTAVLASPSGAVTATLRFRTIPAKAGALFPLVVRGTFRCTDGPGMCVVRKAPLRGEGGASAFIDGEAFRFTLRAKRGTIACQLGTDAHQPGAAFAGVGGRYECTGAGGAELGSGRVDFRRLR